MRYIITHGHIFKNAGSTFDTALKKAFGQDFVDHRDDKSMRKGGAKYLKQYLSENPNIKALSSHHLCNPLPECDDFKCIPVFFLRNPIERIISIYNFEKKQRANTPGALKASSLNLMEYIKWRLSSEAPKTISNYQTMYIGNDRRYKLLDKVDEEVFRNAYSRVVDEDVQIGIVEKFQESFSNITFRLEKYFPGIKFSYINRNVDNKKNYYEKTKYAIEKMQPVLEEIINNNKYDIFLHHVASLKNS